MQRPALASCYSCLLLLRCVHSAAIVAVILPSVDEYRIIFVTEGSIGIPQSTDIEDYNAIVESEALSNGTLAGLNTSWAVVGSTMWVDACDNIGGASTVSTYNTHGELVADGTADLWGGSLSAAIQYKSEVSEEAFCRFQCGPCLFEHRPASCSRRRYRLLWRRLWSCRCGVSNGPRERQAVREFLSGQALTYG